MFSWECWKFYYWTSLCFIFIFSHIPITKHQISLITFMVNFISFHLPAYQTRLNHSFREMRVGWGFSLWQENTCECPVTAADVLLWFCGSVAGVSRSVTLVVAYIMTVTGRGWVESLAAVRSARPCASPNLGFLRQLEEFEHTELAEVSEWRQNPPTPKPKALGKVQKREVIRVSTSKCLMSK